VTSTQLGRLKLKLETRLKELSSSLRNRENIAVERTPDALDEVELAGERDLAISSLDKCSAQIRLVEAALARIADGTYGCCLRCDEEITMKRLTHCHTPPAALHARNMRSAANQESQAY
jgi:DnaK suppressor protein